LAESISKKITYLPEREGDIKHSVANINSAKKILNFYPKRVSIKTISQSKMPK
jgi:UDP-glucose 4-epimerase